MSGVAHPIHLLCYLINLKSCFMLVGVESKALIGKLRIAIYNSGWSLCTFVSFNLNCEAFISKFWNLCRYWLQCWAKRLVMQSSYSAINANGGWLFVSQSVRLFTPSFLCMSLSSILFIERTVRPCSSHGMPGRVMSTKLGLLWSEGEDRERGYRFCEK